MITVNTILKLSHDLAAATTDAGFTFDICAYSPSINSMPMAQQAF